jgi:DNA polymerase-4
MEPAILHVAIDSFAIQAERLRCPKLAGRPVVLAPSDSSRPRVLAASREARREGVEPGTPLLVARRLCRGLIALPPDPDLYAGLSDSIRERLAPFAPFADEAARARGDGAPGGRIDAASGAGRFALDLTGIARSHAGPRDRAAAAGVEVERAFRLHPTLGLGTTRLVSRVAASVLAPDGELLDVLPGSELAFLAPLSARVLPSARVRAVLPRLELLRIDMVRDVQTLTPEQLRAAFGAPAATALWRESRGLDVVTRTREAPARMAVAQETLSQESNDRRAIEARLVRLALELRVTLRARGAAAGTIAVTIAYVDEPEGRARRALEAGERDGRPLVEAARSLLDRALTRRVRVRRIRLEAWETDASPSQLTLWDGDGTLAGASALPGPGGAPSGAGPRAQALESALDRVRARFGSEALVPAAWIAHGLVRSPARS